MSTYEEDRAWSDRFIPAIKRKVGPYLARASSLEQDTREAADLVLRAEDLAIACRVRKWRFAGQFPSHFTVRSQRRNGRKTEWAKILDGWGDWFFYGFEESPGVPELGLWYLIDLDALRWHWRQERGFISGERANGDGTGFRWFDIGSFPHLPGVPRLLIASSRPQDPPMAPPSVPPPAQPPPPAQLSFFGDMGRGRP